MNGFPWLYDVMCQEFGRDVAREYVACRGGQGLGEPMTQETYDAEAQRVRVCIRDALEGQS